MKGEEIKGEEIKGRGTRYFIPNFSIFLYKRLRSTWRLLAALAMLPPLASRASRMSSPLLPGTPVQLQVWKIDDHKAYFRFMNKNTGKAVLNRGVFEWK